MGYYTLLFAHSGFDVLAIEPMTRNRQAINASLCLNPELRRRVNLVPAALGTDAMRSQRCIVHSGGLGGRGNGELTCGEQLACNHSRASSSNCEEVRCASIPYSSSATRVAL